MVDLAVSPEFQYCINNPYSAIPSRRFASCSGSVRDTVNCTVPLLPFRQYP